MTARKTTTVTTPTVLAEVYESGDYIAVIVTDAQTGAFIREEGPLEDLAEARTRAAKIETEGMRAAADPKPVPSGFTLPDTALAALDSRSWTNWTP